MYDYKKMVQVFNWFAKKNGGEIDKLKLMKLIFLADREHLRRYGRFLCGGTYYGMQMGPVHSEAKDLIDQTDFSDEKEIEYRNKFIEKENHTIKSKSEVDYDQFSETDLEILEKIWEIFGKYDKSKLIEITHLLPEWKNQRDLLNDIQRRFVMNIEDFFEELDEESKKKLKEMGVLVEDLELDKEHLEIIKEMAMELQEVDP